MKGQMMQSYRPTTLASNGMVTAPHYLAAGAGLDVLKKGGNAIEAAIAVASTLAVVYPHMNSIGGDNFWLISNQQTKEMKALNSSGRAGQKATIDFYRQKGFTSIPARGYLAAVTVPGAVAGWEEAYEYSKESMGGKLPWAELLAPAISYAKHGYPVTPSQEHWTNVNLNVDDHEFRYLQRFKGFRDTFLKKDGTAYRAGEIMKQPDLARTLEAIAEEGVQVLYRGKIGERIVEEIRENGGVLTKEDFARHRSDWVNPISVPYRGYTAYNLPPNTQGFASLSILNIVNQFDLRFIEEGSSEYYHLLIEATKLAFADRDEWLTDPEFLHIPLRKLLSVERGRQLAAQIDFSHANNLNKQLEPKGDTVWLGVVDKDGNAVSFIQSIYHDFGSGIVPEGTGITLQNRGSFFSLDPEHINRLEPNKRTFHTLNPAMLLKDDRPYLVYGTMGGEGQPQTQAALVTRMIDYGYSVQAAIEAPRWLYGRTWGAGSNSLKAEARIPEFVLQQLSEKGHSVELEEDFSDTMGHAGAILIDPQTNVKHGGADPRGDGAALGF
ncbi:gamma-glutamyltransferase [Domibacillus sp. DTU_2020_1001157_1_SI_ALB_TIR_016]|uniref:gamma-glutamyltransferase n=1 Tax=Domibacillus sp. DTU_2020_1001157_1_SI_ALB_TIR_016 TaxID=3077789 RepID=UPI0028ED2ADB|nr:gamma-glutamyltransferase [Domibacillus sp. DTU_2020_1001157_1_SI_ALB_TIR_016]WNS78947.1 gamma-glutamyltransferase [Domibacillus sp. DTU_2020_1001157_1_SI_ALB_TIR_016]